MKKKKLLPINLKMYKKLIILLALAASLLTGGCGSKKDETIYIGQGKINLYLVNQAEVPEAKMQAIAEAVNIQLHRDILPIWGVDAIVHYQDPPNPKEKTIYILKDFTQFPTEVHSWGGFHTSGTLGYVNYKYPDYVTISTSHEVIEMLLNPDVKKTGYEACDPVAPLDYLIGEEKVSDFVFPKFYDSREVVGPWDYLGQVREPMKPVPGGYIFLFYSSNNGAFAGYTLGEK